MASDLLALLDTLDGLYTKAESSETSNDWTTYIASLSLAYPHLAQALRTALTPTADGERSVRTMFEHLFGGECGARVDVRDEDGDQLYINARCIRCKGHDGAHDHLTPDYSVVDIAFGLRTALNLLATERAKAADAARERAAIVARVQAVVDTLTSNDTYNVGRRDALTWLIRELSSEVTP